ncbi:hypothetical protein CTI12_AA581640 [Artemisia annua]|uniref:Uncharacterized protein n=1 Tax=Artemisia annua TaxID=35608 RepID=A0A2U1KNB9_ARTAN|nr:hypothetical protein CTI12_AA581640 [Artemisia annua]
MFEGETPTRQSQGKNNNSTIEINNPDDLNIKRRGRPSKRVIDVNNKIDSSIPHPGTPSNVRIASSKKQIVAPKTTIFASDTPGNYQEGIKGSKYKTSAMCSSRLTSDAPSRQFQVNVAQKKSSTSNKNLFTNDTPGSQLEASRIPKKNVPGSLTIGNYTASSMSKHKYNMRVESKSIRSNMSNFTTASQGYGKQPAYMAEDDVDTLYYGSVSSGKKGSQSKNLLMNTSTIRGMYLRQEKDSIMNALAFGYAPRGMSGKRSKKTGDYESNAKYMVNKDISLIVISDDEEPKPNDLMKKETPVVNEDRLEISDDDLPIQFKRSKTSQNSTLYYQHKFMLLDEDTDDDIHNNTATTEDNEDGIWDHMVDIDGKLNGEDAFDSYIDEEAWEVDSDVYSNNDTDSGEDF